MKEHVNDITFKLRNWARMNKPFAASSEKWDEWEQKFKNEAPVRYFLFEELPNRFGILQRKISDIRYAIRHRTIDKYHIIKINSLKPGYYDSDTRMLHGMFSLLEDYVEIELAVLNEWAEKQDEENPPVKKSAREHGISHLDWEMDLEEELQAKSAKEIKELYLWWKDVRPNRLDPWDIIKEMKDKEDESKYVHFEELEQEQYDEDTEMLIRLVKIRKALWT